MNRADTVPGILIIDFDRQGRIGGDAMPAALLDNRIDGGGQFARDVYDDVSLGGEQLRGSARLLEAAIPGSCWAGNVTEPGGDAAGVRGHAERRIRLSEDNAAAGGVRGHAGARAFHANVAAARIQRGSRCNAARVDLPAAGVKNRVTANVPGSDVPA